VGVEVVGLAGDRVAVVALEAFGRVRGVGSAFGDFILVALVGVVVGEAGGEAAFTGGGRGIEVHRDLIDGVIVLSSCA
jgi:hypothetical protein